MAIPDDAHYIPGTMRRAVRLGDGSRVSRQTAENIYARSREFQSDYERRKAYRASKQAGQYDRDKGKAAERGISKREFDETRARLYADKMRNGNDWKRIDKSPGGPLAEYLVAIGRRSAGADWTVGDSPGI